MGALPRLPERARVMDWCFYCDLPIYSFDKRVDGVEPHAAHRRCVQKRIRDAEAAKKAKKAAKQEDQHV